MSEETRAAAVTGALLLLFPLLITVHVATLFGVARRAKPMRLLAALLLPPLAPYWAYVAGMRATSIVWTVLAVGYAGALALAS